MVIYMLCLQRLLGITAQNAILLTNMKIMRQSMKHTKNS